MIPRALGGKAGKSKVDRSNAKSTMLTSAEAAPLGEASIEGQLWERSSEMWEAVTEAVATATAGLVAADSATEAAATATEA
eukprot:scaffold3039_cov72-Phaeocystis_antarctica.AAC.1